MIAAVRAGLGLLLSAVLLLPACATGATGSGVGSNAPVVAGGEGPKLAARTRVTVYATADVGECGGAPADTARLVPTGANLVVPGDIAYPRGTRTDFLRCFLPFYGRLLATTFPVPGNHEYYDPQLAYFDVFGPRVGTPRRPWYSVRFGSWRFWMLNSNCAAVGGCGKGSRQYRWLQRRLSVASAKCMAAVWHAPRWSSGKHGSSATTAALYRLLQRAGTDLLLSGHDHSYERFARLSATGQQRARGIRQFVVGTGGADLYRFRDVVAGSQVRSRNHHGVLRLRLTGGRYAWRFLATDGANVDHGRDTCR